jgi:ribosomal protein S18 acetylase RimI-like enzyme
MGLRRATPDDADDLVRLRQVMYDAMDVDHTDPGWAAECARVLRAGLAGGSMAAYVVEDGGRIVACGVGMVEQRLPGPRNPRGRHGHVQSMATDPDARRRGYAREVFGALLEWFAEQGVPSVDLHATPYGEPLYRSYGFTEPRWAALTRRSP